MTERPVWLDDPALQQLFAATRDMGGEARVVGGAVRDFLMGRDSGDVDIASSLPPESTIAIANALRWKAVPTGLAHGTVTLVLPARVVEVTTLRRDIETDGRHAQIVHTDNFAEDAERRDFTMNALYMDAAGTIYDEVGGQKDLQARRVRFIGDAPTRIMEDALRILRFFRFLATHGSVPADREALVACEAHRALIANLSGERIAQEMRKLLVAPQPADALNYMVSIGLSEYLTEAPWDMARLKDLLQHEREFQLLADGWVRLLAMLAPFTRGETAHWIGERWKLSRFERATLLALAHTEIPVDPARVKEWLRAHPRKIVIGRILLAALDSDEELATADLMQLAQGWEIPRFPVTASDLLKQGMTQGKDLGEALRALEQRWIDSDYQLSRAELLRQ
jgi:poly(A) polymerase